MARWPRRAPPCRSSPPTPSTRMWVSGGPGSPLPAGALPSCFLFASPALPLRPGPGGCGPCPASGGSGGGCGAEAGARPAPGWAPLPEREAPSGWVQPGLWAALSPTWLVSGPGCTVFGEGGGEIPAACSCGPTRGKTTHVGSPKIGRAGCVRRLRSYLLLPSV